VGKRLNIASLQLVGWDRWQASSLDPEIS